MVLDQFYSMIGVAAVAGLTKSGVSTTKERDVLRYDVFQGYQDREKVQWDYRDNSGKLHSSICNDIESARIQAARHGYIEGVSREERV
ncbi:MAG: hypothetical protein IMZ58_08190 [Thermoplasmata archaeon]|nr:hypothetical protein [Thermoplasmata archaeon]